MKCHSKRSVSRGEARKKGEGWLVNSWASFTAHTTQGGSVTGKGERIGSGGKTYKCGGWWGIWSLFWGLLGSAWLRMVRGGVDR